MEGVIGYTTLFAGNFAPKGWMMCSGQIINIQSNTALFSILGTTYGGNGTTTFGIPDLRGRTVIGQGTGPGLSSYVLGEMTGGESDTLTSGQMPFHVHPVTVVAANPSTDGDANITTVNASVYGRDTNGLSPYGTGPGSTNMGALVANITMAPAGGNAPFSIQRPLLGLNYVLCTQGVYPARN